MSETSKQTKAELRIQPGFFSEKEAAAIADAIVAVLFQKPPVSRPDKP